MLKYMSSLPMWLQITIILIILLIIIGLAAVIIYKIAAAERIKASPTGIELDDMPEGQPVITQETTVNASGIPMPKIPPQGGE